jgi:signal transduction histidine kinase/CheY-like chemotaxis protein
LNAELESTGRWEGELVQRRRDGSTVNIDCREVLVKGDDGKRESVLAIKRDATQLRHTIEALQQADRRKDEFLATLAHELRNPLAPIRNAVEVMRLANGDTHVIEQSRLVLDRQAGQMARMVEDLIDMARIVEKKIELRLETCRLNVIVDAAVETCGPVIERNDQRLTVSMPDSPLFVEADPVRVSQMLINLLHNASKYSDGGTEIQLVAERVPPTPAMKESGATEAVSLRVRDQGQGIASNLLPRVFDMFTQGPRSTQQGRGGLGVGLALVRSLAELHGGTADVRSDGVGHGSEFIVVLPLSAQEPEERRKTPRRSSRRTSQRRILVVDDNDDQVLSLAMLLTLQGHTVEHATSGREALERAAEFKPDIALVDLGMPDLNGLEVARRIRELPGLRNVVLVAQTGWGSDDDRKRSAEAGFDIHLVKPVTATALDEVVRTAKR